jgi:hypothetical protein
MAAHNISVVISAHAAVDPVADSPAAGSLAPHD